MNAIWKCFTFTNKNINAIILITWRVNKQESGDNMQIGNDIGKVKKDIEELVGQHVVIRCNSGKRRTTVSKGMLESAYPSVFVFKNADTMTNTSFSYTDLIQNRVEFLAKGEKATSDFIIED